MANLASTTDPAVNPATGQSAGRYMRRRRISSNAFLGATALVILFGVSNVAGVQSSTTTATANGTTIAVRHGQFARAGLATPFEIKVTKLGGFDEPVIVAVDDRYLAMFDENGLSPAPESETTIGDSLVWEFEPPPVGDTLTIGLDARIEPARQLGGRGRVAVLDKEYQPVVEVEFRTRLWP